MGDNASTEEASIVTTEDSASNDDSIPRCSSKLNPQHPNWNNWRWQMSNRITSTEELLSLFPTIDISSILTAIKKFPMAITPYYASLIQQSDYSDPIFAQCIPDIKELYDSPVLKDDPLDEEKDTVVPGLIHRYSDRALFVTTSMCGMYCRHCTRKRITGEKECVSGLRNLDKVISYLKSNSQITDVIISGGDPFTMSTEVLETIINGIRSVSSVEIIRIGTRTPVVMPMRITDELVKMLNKYHPLYVNTHFNHPQEITEEAKEACLRLVNTGIPVGNQSVLLKNINNDPKIMMQLCKKLIGMRVKPYYLFQCDLVRGIEHFRTSITSGIDIMEYLRGRMSGFGIPQFVVDAPEGKGKIPLLPNYKMSSDENKTILRNYKYEKISYPEPYK